MEALPQGWTKAYLSDLVTALNYGFTAASEESGPGPKFLRITDLQDGSVDWASVPRCRCPELARFLLRPGDIVVARTGATTGKSYLIRDTPEDAVFASYLIRLSPIQGISSEYVAAYLKSPSYWRNIMQVAKGTAQPGANASTLGNLEVPVAPLHEQGRLVAKLEALLARSRRAKEALDAVPALLERFRQSVLAAAFRGDLTREWRERNPGVEPASKLLERIRVERKRRWEEAELERMRAKGSLPKDEKWKRHYKPPQDPICGEGLAELPESWCWAPAGDLVEPGADIVYGIVQPGPEVPNGVPYVRGMDIEDGRILENQLRRTSSAIANRYERASLRGGDVLLGIIRATKVALVPASLSGANITQGTARFRPTAGISSDFLAGWLEGPEAQSRLHSMYRGIDMPGLNLRDVRRLPIPVAPVQEQIEIGQRLSRFWKFEARVRTESASALFKVPDLETSLLAKAFRGELVPQDPNDEPASVLLERIRAGREQSETAELASRPKRRREPKVA